MNLEGGGGELYIDHLNHFPYKTVGVCSTLLLLATKMITFSSLFLFSFLQLKNILTFYITLVIFYYNLNKKPIALQSPRIIRFLLLIKKTIPTIFTKHALNHSINVAGTR
jgi:hypothetical protein